MGTSFCRKLNAYGCCWTYQKMWSSMMLFGCRSFRTLFAFSHSFHTSACLGIACNANLYLVSQVYFTACCNPFSSPLYEPWDPHVNCSLSISLPLFLSLCVSFERFASFHHALPTMLSPFGFVAPLMLFI